MLISLSQTRRTLVCVKQMLTTFLFLCSMQRLCALSFLFLFVSFVCESSLYCLCLFIVCLSLFYSIVSDFKLRTTTRNFIM